jgi:hypothetical protein
MTNLREINKNLDEERKSQLLSKLEKFSELAREGHISDLILIGKIKGESMTEFDWDSNNPLEVIGALDLAKFEVMSEALIEAEMDQGDSESD